jgi:arsenate reductase-like glutaredoxin family protein
MNNFEEHSITELIQIVKQSDDSKAFLTLLEKVAEKVSDVRTKLDGIQNDSLDLRTSTIKVIEDMLINPLMIEKPIKSSTEHTDYT